jgi:hypothetical protein
MALGKTSQADSGRAPSCQCYGALPVLAKNQFDLKEEPQRKTLGFIAGIAPAIPQGVGKLERWRPVQ